MFDIIEKPILIFLVIVMIFCLIYLYRNTKVFYFRKRLLNEEAVCRIKLIESGKLPNTLHFKRFDNLPSYNIMLLKFWVKLSSYEKPIESYYTETKES